MNSMDYEPPITPAEDAERDADLESEPDALEGQVLTSDGVSEDKAQPWSSYMAYSNERVAIKVKYRWGDKEYSPELKLKRGTRLTALIEKLSTGRSAPWNKWTAPPSFFLVHKATLLDSKRVVGDYSVDQEVVFDLFFNAEEADALVKATRGQFEDYRPPHRDMLDDKLKQWETQGAARRRSTCDFVNFNVGTSTLPSALNGTQPLQGSGSVRRTSVVTVVLEGGSTVMAPSGTPQLPTSTLTNRQDGSMPTLPARRSSQSATLALQEQATLPKTLERVKVVVEFSNGTQIGFSYTHEQIVTRGSRFEDVVHSIRSKSFHSSYNDKCSIVYKGYVVEPRRSIGDYVANDKVMRCVVARDAEATEVMKKQTAEEGYRPPYEGLIEERRKAREASAAEATERMRADLPSPRDSRSAVTITVTTVPVPDATQARRPSAGDKRRASQSRRVSKGGGVLSTISPQEEEREEGGAHLPPIA